MKKGNAIGNLLKAAVVIAGIYAFFNWDSIRPQQDELSIDAEQACVSEIRSRYATKSLKAYSVKKTSTGYVVRASATLPRGNAVKVYCLTNEHGGVEDIRIEE